MSVVLSHSTENRSDMKVSGPINKNVQETIDLCRSKFRENIGIESIRILEADSSKYQAVGHYIHQKIGENAGKIGSLVKIESESAVKNITLEEIGNNLARQTVALGDTSINMSKLLSSEYLFAPIGTVRNFIESMEEKLNTKLSVLDMAHVKIK
jgi:translation elongation factor EF-Ts